VLKKKGKGTGVGDEGGYAPDLSGAEEALELILVAIAQSGLKPVTQVALALDCAASEFFDRDKRIYRLEGEEKSFDAAGLVDWYQSLCLRYPIISIEDGCAEDDWEGWAALTRALGPRVQLVGDDIFVTNPERIRRGIE